MSSRQATRTANRPPVDVVIPFAGSASELRSLLGRLASVRAELPGTDTLRVADNRPAGAEPILGVPEAGVQVLRAPARASSYHARNRAARDGVAPWLLFLDADVDWKPSLPDAYFEPWPAERVGVLAGGLIDAPLPRDRPPTAAERYAVRAATMAASNTLTQATDASASVTARRPYAQTANCLVRRTAFEQIGGFPDGVRSGGDADLCWRLLAAGWTLEARSHAGAVHRNRRTLRALLAQKSRHGSGSAWLEGLHPGSFPARGRAGLLRWSAQCIVGAQKTEDGHDRRFALVDVLAVWAFELGRHRGNEASVGIRSSRATRRRT